VTGTSAETPGVRCTVDAISCALSAGPMTMVGVPDPAGKCRASASPPVTDSTVVRNVSDCFTPSAFSVGRKAARISRPMPLAMATPRGWSPTSRATRAQIPRVSGPCVPTCGIDGQNTHRPCSPGLLRPGSTSSAGRNVIAESSAAAMPMAPTGPRPFVDCSSLSSRHSRPRMTVPAEAATGSMVRFQASHIAS
jgi:hypothetical protein